MMQLRILAVATLSAMMLVTCKGQPPTDDPATPTPAFTPVASSAPAAPGVALDCAPQVGDLPCAIGVEPGKAYAYRLYTHCGILWAYFKGQWWEASPPLNDGSGNPPKGWGNPYDAGTIELVSDAHARFTSKSGLTAEFKPLPVEVQEYPGKICS